MAYTVESSFFLWAHRFTKKNEVSRKGKRAIRHTGFVFSNWKSGIEVAGQVAVH
jgi:hypothetical protein